MYIWDAANAGLNPADHYIFINGYTKYIMANDIIGWITRDISGWIDTFGWMEGIHKFTRRLI